MRNLDQKTTFRHYRFWLIIMCAISISCIGIFFHKTHAPQNPENQNNRLYVPTMIQKYDDTYFIVDCWHHRILYHNKLETNLEKWNTLTDEGYMAGHTIATDGNVYVLDNTEANEVLVYQKEKTALLKRHNPSQEF